MVRNDLKTSLKVNLLSPRDCADYCGVTYSSLMQQLNGFNTLKPEIEKKINEFIQLKGQTTVPGSKITGRHIG